MKFIQESILDLIFESEPFPYTVIDDFIKPEYLPLLLKEMDQLSIHHSYYHGHDSIEKNKFAFKSNFQPTLQQLFQELNSDEFIDLIEKQTGIPNIIRNNLNLNGAGVHKVLNNGFLCMHADFEGYRDDTYGLLDRRLNLLLYMNPDWKEAYHGELCLYDKHAQKITKKILPLLNRCVLFFTPNNIHGHPKPLDIPGHLCRQSITTYYYTKNTTGQNLQGGPIEPVQWYPDIKDN